MTEAGASRESVESVAALVLATKTHDPSSHADAPLQTDIDLSILGRPKDRFDEYETQIRREYDWVPAEHFAAGRADVLQRFLSRKRIYSTELFFRKYESQARIPEALLGQG
jgi:predicted metal-dependent HD superfamily phosphohydrolase